MSRITGSHTLAAGLLRKSVALFSLGFVLLFAQPGQAEPLTFFKNYFITGDYVVRGASLWRKGVNGKAVAEIPRLDSLGGPNGVPGTADIEAAFLYIQTAERIQGSGVDHGGVHVKFVGNDLGPFTAPEAGAELGSGTYAKALVDWNTAAAPCWSLAFPGQRKLITYRVDALRFLAIDPFTKKQALNTPHRIEVPDMGPLFTDDDEIGRERTDVMGPRAVGASLVVVYRDRSKPFSGIVLYDGTFTKRAFAPPMTQTIKGFYQASTASPIAKMTHIVGDGRPFLFEKVTIGTQQFLNPYVSANGPKWDNPTFSSLQLPSFGGVVDSIAVTVDRLGLLSDCVSFSAMIFRTTVQDTDHDGLLDVWEQDPPPFDVRDPLNRLPNLALMGAKPDQKDLFTEIGYMDAAEGTAYGGVPKPAHSHLPTYEALKMVGDAFKNGPTPIHVHFDVGNNYQLNPNGSPTEYIIRENLARGGKNIPETMACVDAGGALVECRDQAGQQLPLPGQYPQYPGTVGWKTGFRFLRDEILGFDDNRKDMFHYLLSGHFVGIPKEPCLNPDGTANVACQEGAPGVNPDPNFRVPRTYSGIGDFPGGDTYLSLGGFDDTLGRPIGTPFMQGSTILHEWGHNFEFTHGGPLAIGRLPNCRSQHFSSMNYMYQLVGFTDESGIAHLGYESGVTDPIMENPLADAVFGAGLVPYRLGFYAPKRNSYLKVLGKAATKHCDGSDLSQAELDDLNNSDRLGGMVRVNATSVATAIDWNADGTQNSAGLGSGIPPGSPPGFQDINFNGSLETLAGGANEWAFIRLNELGGRRNVGGYYRDTAGRKAVGPLSLDVGRGDIGRGDIGRGDIGRGDIGRGDIGRGDIGRGDIGRGDIGRGDIGRGDIGRGDIGRGGGDTDVGATVGGKDEPFVELDVATARAVQGDAPDAPSGLRACLTLNLGACASEGGRKPVRLSWDAPHFGTVTSYTIYRFTYEGEFVPPTLNDEMIIANVFAPEFGTPPTTYLDYFAPNSSQVAYVVTANFDDESTSGISNFATVQTPAPAIFLQDLGLVAPPATLGGQTMFAFGPDTREGTTETTVPSPLGGSVGFGASLFHRQVNGVGFPAGWRTWSHGYTGDVYYTGGSGESETPTTLTKTLPPGTTAFYFYAEPRNFGEFTFTITTSGGETFVTTGAVLIEGEAGAHGFGFYTFDTTIASITVTAVATANGFAVGEFGIGRVP